ncbi:MAG TPA: glyoxalase superfamily protein [Steroidobacteraceae bacterium]|jgi:hypothetical protein
MRDFRDAKAMAQTMRTTLSAMGFKITVGQSLELIAKAFGVVDWNTLSAAIRPETAAAHERLFCSFCGKSPNEVRSFCEGSCSRQRHASQSCVFICDECVALCAQVNADTIGSTESARSP